MNKNVYEALYTADNAFIKRWGGESYRRGFTLEIKSRVGADRGFEIRTGKNLINLEMDTNISSLATRLYPIGFDGISIPEKYIDSPLINNYSKVYAKEIKFDQVKVKRDDDDEGFATLAEAQAELRRLTNLMYTRDKVDIVGATYDVNFVDWTTLEEGEGFTASERTYLGDDVKVKDENMGIDITVRVTKRTYDALRKIRLSTELSNKDTKAKPPSIKDIFDIIENLPSEDSILEQAKKDATDIINNGMKDSYVIVRKNEILIMDTPDVNTAMKIWRWNNGGLGYSSTGYYGTFGTAITNDGKIVANFITTGVLNANVIKAGMLQSLNGQTTLNMETGHFSNNVGGYGVDIDKGGVTFSTGGELVAGIRSTSFADDRSINGLSIANYKKGDYIDIGFTDTDNFTESSQFTPMMRFSKIVSGLLGNFKGIQLFESVRLGNGNKMFLTSNNPSYPHEIFNTLQGDLAIAGDNGIIFGYKAGANFETLMELREVRGNTQSKMILFDNLSLNYNKIQTTTDIFTGVNNGRYYHEGWCGAIEKTAKRISNLNVFFDSGWYAYSTGSQGAPSGYGVMLHLKWGEEDFVQVAFDFANNMYQRAWVNGAWTNWKTR